MAKMITDEHSVYLGAWVVYFKLHSKEGGVDVETGLNEWL